MFIDRLLSLTQLHALAEWNAEPDIRSLAEWVTPEDIQAALLYAGDCSWGFDGLNNVWNKKKNKGRIIMRISKMPWHGVGHFANLIKFNLRRTRRLWKLLIGGINSC